MTTTKNAGAGTVIGKVAPDFTLPNHQGLLTSLDDLCRESPVLLVFYPGDFTAVCTKQLCSYRDSWRRFKEFGVQIIGVSPNPMDEHVRFASQHEFPFLLLSDGRNTAAREFGCTSIFMLGKVSRATFILNRKRMILYRYVEPTILTHRGAEELLGIVSDLRKNKLI